MALPEYAEVEEPLLCFIYLHGGRTRAVPSHTAYEPLANYFGLSAADRAVPREGRGESKWNNMVQWARRKLKSRGHLATSGHGTWQLSEAGVAAARLLAPKYPQSWAT